MELTKGDKTVKVPAWVLVAGITTVGVIVGDICKTIAGKRQ